LGPTVDLIRVGVLAFVAICAAAATAYAQDPVPPAPDTVTKVDTPESTNTWFMRVGYSPRRGVVPDSLASGANAARTLTVDIGRQTDGTRTWHRIYNYPSYGVGMFIGRFDSEQTLGRPLAAYGFFSWPFPLSRRAQVTADLALGLSWNWNCFDPQTNPANTALGSDMAVHVDGGVALRYLASSRTSIYAGLNASHWSNGGTRQPNLGLAAIGPKVSVRYDVAPHAAPSPARAAPLPPFEPSWEFVVGATGGRKNATTATHASIDALDRLRDFGAFNVTTALQRNIYQLGKVEGGADVTYDGATGARVDLLDGARVYSRAAYGRRFAAGLYGGYEHVIARVSVLLHVGYTVWRRVEDLDVPHAYQRYGVRFHLSDHLWSTLAVRTTKWRKANFPEFGLGYGVRWR
jgi:hypothetical protein